MNTTNLLKIALRALANNKLRGFLTMLGIIIGVASVITMLAILRSSSMISSPTTKPCLYCWNFGYLAIIWFRLRLRLYRITGNAMSSWLIG